MEEIKPCPVCGGECGVMRFSFMGALYAVVCWKDHSHYSTIISSTAEGAIDAWNKKVEKTLALSATKSAEPWPPVPTVTTVSALSATEMRVESKESAPLVKEFDFTIYPRTLWMSVGGSVDRLSKHFIDYYTREELSFEMANNNAVALAVIQKSTGQIGFLVVFRNKGAMTPKVMAHESAHVATSLWEDLRESEMGDEANAYLIGWIVDCMNKVRMEESIAHSCKKTKKHTKMKPLKTIVLFIMMLVLLSGCENQEQPKKDARKPKYKVTLYNNFGTVLEVKYAHQMYESWDFGGHKNYTFQYFGEGFFGSESWEWNKANVKIERIYP